MNSSPSLLLLVDLDPATFAAGCFVIAVRPDLSSGHALGIHKARATVEFWKGEVL